MGPEREGARARAQGESGPRAGRGRRARLAETGGPTPGQAGRAGGPSEEPRQGARLASAGGASPDHRRGLVEAGTPARGLSGPTDFLDRTDGGTPRSTPPLPRPYPRAGAASSRDSLGHPFLLHFFFRLRLSRLPRRQCLPLPGGAPGSRQSSP